MKSFILLAFAIALLIPTQSVLALGGGKANPNAKFQLTSAEPSDGISIAVWVRPVGTPVPATLGALRNMLIFVDASETRFTGGLNEGEFSITIFDAANTVGAASTVISQADVDNLDIETRTFDISDNNVLVSFDSDGFFPRSTTSPPPTSPPTTSPPPTSPPTTSPPTTSVAGITNVETQVAFPRTNGIDNNGNGFADPGDTFELDIVFTAGASGASDITFSNLAVTLPGDSVGIFGATIPTLAAGEEFRTDPFGDACIQIFSFAVPGDEIFIEFDVTADGTTTRFETGPFIVGEIQNDEILPAIEVTP